MSRNAKSPLGDDLRRNHRRIDFPGGLGRGNLAARIAQSCNIVRLDPEIAAAFPKSAAVNEALGEMLRAARAARMRAPAHSRSRGKTGDARER